MEERAEKTKKINDTLLELGAGIVAAGILFQIALVWLVKNKLMYSIGLWIGVGLALFHGICGKHWMKRWDLARQGLRK